MKKITLYGAGGHCYAVMALINSLGTHKPTLLLDDQPTNILIDGLPVADRKHTLDTNEIACITIGNNVHRKRISEILNKQFPSFIHKSVICYNPVIGKGTVVLPGAVIDADVSLGDFCIVNLNATLSHNVRVENYCHIAINAAVAGGVHIGEGTLIGASSVVIPNVKIGKWVTVGAGAVVTKDVPDYAIVYGNPARIIKYNTNNE